ncbi:MAG: DUF1934 domain-containing protein [Oscillospiraceae bacterium]|nr:DUF1934 domain-containing protein [Oscillospiraceae bacterium]
MKNTKVSIMMEQIFENNERDCVQMETVAQLAQEADKLHVIFEGREMIFEVGKTHLCRYPVAGGELLLRITTHELEQDESRVSIKYEIADFNGSFISENKLKMELENL